MHFQSRNVNKISRPNEFFVQMMLAKHMTNILTKETLNAFPEFLHAIDILLGHSPRSIRHIGWARMKLLDFLFDPEVP
jgi:hypothetical protein